MPSPIGHFLCGAAIGSLFTPANKPLFVNKILLGGLLATAPDLDMLLSLAGLPYVAVHRTFSHSLATIFIIFVGLWAANLFFQKNRINIQIPYFFISFCLLSHIILDLMGEDIYGPKGLMLFWPISYEWIPPLIEFFPSSLDIYGNPASLNTLAIISGIEFFLFTPIFLFTLWFRSLKFSRSKTK